MRHLLTVAAPAPDVLRRVAPLWAFGLEGAWLSRHLAAQVAAGAAREAATVLAAEEDSPRRSAATPRQDAE